MSLSEERILALAEAVTAWRLQENICIAFYSLYVYYVLTTMAEEASIIHPQRWNRGKMLYMLIRYGLLAFISLQLTRDYRNYFSIFPDACKVLYVVCDVVHYLVALTCDFSLGLCLGALLQSKPLYLSATVILSCGIPVVNALINIVSFIQYPAELVSPLDTELGYPCYVPSAEGWIEKTIMYVGRDIRSYLNLVTTALLALLGVVTVVIRYRGQGGRLVRVISWDGGVHYLSLLAIRMTVAILWTPAVLLMLELERNPVYLLADVANRVVIPILAQRLLINMRKVDYMGSVPVASKLLFAHSASVSEGDTESYLNSLVVAQGPPGYPNQGATRQTTEQEATMRRSNV